MPTRRQVVHGLLSSLLVACARDDEDTADTALSGCPEDLDGFAFDGVEPFTGEADRPLEELTGTGLDARYVVDLRTLDESTLLLPPERFYIRTGEPTGLDPSDWRIAVRGLATDTELRIADLLAEVEDIGAAYMECSGNTLYGGFGLMSAARFAGIPLGPVIDTLDIDPGATAIRVEGLDSHPPSSGSQAGASWVFPIDTLRAGWLVTEMDGGQLPRDHGAPVRLWLPHWWGCACIKWVTALTVVDDTEPATSQMQEFAARTHQDGVPALAADYIPATRDPAGTAIRVERWVRDGEIRHRVIGLYWGPAVDNTAWRVHVGDGPGQPLSFCVPRTSDATWGLWEAIIDADAGEYRLALSLDADIPTRRLDSGHYTRTVQLG